MDIKKRRSDKDDRELLWVKKIQKGDENAFRELFKTYYQKLVNHARRYVHDTHIAENIVEDIFLKIWQDRKKWHLSISLKAYLFRAVRNHSLNYLKRLKLEKTNLANLSRSFNDTRTPEDHLTEKETLAQIQQAVSELPERAHSVFVMHRYDNLKYSEIAEILNISVGTVETHMVRALKFLRKRLVDLFFVLMVH